MDGNGKDPLPLNVRQGFPQLCNSLGNVHAMDELFFSLSTFAFETLTMTKHQQVRYVNNIFRKKDNLNVAGRSELLDIYLCPVCMEEDQLQYGEPYIRRSHQLNGICTCHKHGCMLRKYVGQRGHACDYNQADFKTVDSTIAIELLNLYTKYVQNIFAANVMSNIEEVKAIIMNKVHEMGYSSDDKYASLIDDMKDWKYKDLWIKEPSLLISRRLFFGVKYLNSPEIIPLLMFLFPDPKDFLQLVTNKPIIKEYQCDICNKKYYSTEQAELDGWGCPYCDEKNSLQDRLARLVNTIGKNQYFLKGDYLSLGKTVDVYHNRCQKVIKMIPVKFMFEEIKCPCERKIMFKDAKKMIEANAGFRLIEFKDTSTEVTILHEECGEIFTRKDLYRFRDYPFCKHCHPWYMKPELYEKKVRDLVGDEYTVIRGYRNSDEQVILRHEKCGIEQPYIPRKFLYGQRCKECTEQISLKTLDRMLREYSEGKYKIKEYQGGRYIIENTIFGEIKGMDTARILQEILRPTPSDILPVENKHAIIRPLSQWEKMFRLLLEFKDEYGTVVVQNKRMYKGLALGEWCARQRREHKKGILKEPRKKALINIGFEFNPTERDWNLRYEQYKRYIADNNGNPYITCSVIYEGMSLGDWVVTQHEKFMAGKLPVDQLEKMKEANPDMFAISGNFSHHKQEWLRKYELYKCYIEEIGSAEILHRAAYKGELLGRWVVHQRENYKAGKLSEERILLMRVLDPNRFN